MTIALIAALVLLVGLVGFVGGLLHHRWAHAKKYVYEFGKMLHDINVLLTDIETEMDHQFADVDKLHRMRVQWSIRRQVVREELKHCLETSAPFTPVHYQPAKEGASE